MLTGNEIIKQIHLGRITMEPFEPGNVGPNSIDIRLGEEVHEVVENDMYIINTRLPSKTLPIAETGGGGFMLMPGRHYLAHSIESFGSDHYVPTLHGRSSAARHGLMVHITAGFCDIGWRGVLIFELVNMSAYPMIIYPGDRIAQVAFEEAQGERATLYKSTYQGQHGIVAAKGLGK